MSDPQLMMTSGSFKSQSSTSSHTGGWWGMNYWLMFKRSREMLKWAYDHYRIDAKYHITNTIHHTTSWPLDLTKVLSGKWRELSYMYIKIIVNYKVDTYVPLLATFLSPFFMTAWLLNIYIMMFSSNDVYTHRLRAVFLSFELPCNFT